MSTSRTLVVPFCSAFLLFLFVAGLTPQPALAGQDIFNVKKYGAKGNGVDDDQAAIQATFDAAAKKRGTAFFPPGNYLHSDNLAAINISIDGGSQAILTATNAAAPSLILNSNSSVRRLNVQTNQDVPGIGANSAAIVVRGNHITVRDCSVSGTFQTGLGLLQSGDNTNHITISRCNFSPGGNAAPRGIIANGGIQIEISDCNFVGYYGIEFGGASQIRITRNNFTNNNIGIHFDNLFTGRPDTVQIDHNRFTGVLQHGIFIRSPNGVPNASKYVSNLTISDNQFTGAPDNIGFGFLNYGTLYRARISNNVITAFDADGITLSDLGQSNEVQVSGNRISNCGGGVAQRTGSSTVISNNDIRNVRFQAVYIQNTANFLTVEKNKLFDCGSFGGEAVILIGNGSGSVRVASNTYGGNTQNIQFFIRAYPPQTVLKGNTTTTTLPSKVGP